MPSLEICLSDIYPVINYLSCKLIEPEVIIWLHTRQNNYNLAAVEE